MVLNWNLQIKVELKCEQISQQECCKTEVLLFGNGLEVPEAQSFRSTESNPPAPEWQSNVKNPQTGVRDGSKCLFMQLQTAKFPSGVCGLNTA